MDFELDDDQRELQRTVREVLDNECPPAYVRRIVDEGHDPVDLWSTLTDLDWPALTLDPEVGGLGMTWVEQAVVLEELGYASAPGPSISKIAKWERLIMPAPSLMARCSALAIA